MSAPEPSVLPATPLTDAIEPGSQSEDFEADCREAIRLCRRLERERAQVIAALKVHQLALRGVMRNRPENEHAPTNMAIGFAVADVDTLLRALGEVK